MFIRKDKHAVSLPQSVSQFTPIDLWILSNTRNPLTVGQRVIRALNKTWREIHQRICTFLFLSLSLSSNHPSNLFAYVHAYTCTHVGKRNHLSGLQQSCVTTLVLSHHAYVQTYEAFAEHNFIFDVRATRKPFFVFLVFFKSFTLALLFDLIQCPGCRRLHRISFSTTDDDDDDDVWPNAVNRREFHSTLPLFQGYSCSLNTYGRIVIRMPSIVTNLFI